MLAGRLSWLVINRRGDHLPEIQIEIPLSVNRRNRTVPVVFLAENIEPSDWFLLAALHLCWLILFFLQNSKKIHFRAWLLQIYRLYYS
jgi:hypothetical protein